MRSAKAADINVEEISRQDAAQAHPLLDLLLWAFKWFVSAIVAVVLVFFIAATVIPSVGATFITTTGINEQSAMAEVLAYWLVPQLFVSAMLGVLVVKIVKGVYKGLARFGDKLICRKYAKDKTSVDNANTKKRTRGVAGKKTR